MNRIFMRGLIFGTGFLFLACASHPGAVNSKTYIPIVPIGNEEVARANEAFDYRPTELAISGQVMESASLPMPAPHVNLALYYFEESRWNLITELTTEIDGKFNISRPLKAGAYELRVMGKRYRGKLSINLNKKPATDLLMMITNLDDR